MSRRAAAAFAAVTTVSPFVAPGASRDPGAYYLGGPPPNYTIASLPVFGITNRPHPASPLGTSAAGPRPTLPVVEVRTPATPRNVLAVVITGDGGWAAADKGIADALAERGVDVVGLDARRYLSRPRTPDEAGHDLEALLRYYLPAWGRERAVLIGYSRGAELAPFMASRLPADLRHRLALVVMLGPSGTANFQFHWSDLVRNSARPTDLPVLPELERLRGTPMLCVYGHTDARALCPSLDSTLARSIVRDAGHYVHKGDGPEIVERILAAIGEG